jgi:formylglycine-generating enzyme required for sulfatase activity/tRNA A-37 threonylcarbamoyl transferase component Bud32
MSEETRRTREREDTTPTGSLPSFSLLSGVEAPLALEPPLAEGAKPIDVVGDPDRYFDVGLIARGGMSEVRRVVDRKLNRALAMKILDWDYLSERRARNLFIMEAGITAGLQHPGIVPVHDWGELTDGRLWFTMKEVRGRTLAELIELFHRAQVGGDWVQTEEGWSLHRLVDCLRRACEAVAHAHRHDIIHRDIKPLNLMVGELAEVQVMDWGLASRVGVEPGPDLAGTPAYMSPEQAAGQALGPETDVYSLGAVLHCILVGQPPYVGDAAEVLTAVLSGESPLLDNTPGPDRPHPPAALVEIYERATVRSVTERFRDAGELATELAAWLEGARRRKEALVIVQEADALLPKIEHKRVEAQKRRAQAATILRELGARAPARRKAEAWALDERATRDERDAQIAQVRWFQLLRAALNLDDTLPEAHERLARHYHDRLLDAEAGNRADEAARCEAFLRAHDRGRYAAALRGEGRLTLHTDPPGAGVVAYRWVERERRLVLERFGKLGVTPLDEVAIPRGSYLLLVRARKMATVRVPVLIERAGHWDGVPPGAGETQPIRLTTHAAQPRGFVRVPGGWFRSGGDRDAADGLPARPVWVNDFLVGRYPVTNREYIAFLDALVDAGRADEAERWAPRTPLGVGANADDSELQLGRDAAGHFHLTRDHVGQEWQPNWPVCLVSWHAAMAYAQWRAAALDRQVRLPNELEWEKAARGVDGRAFPWGSFLDPSWANILSSAASPSRCAVTSYPIDTSPYGARQLTGNVREWCVNPWRFDGPPVVDGILQTDEATVDDPS